MAHILRPELDVDKMKNDNIGIDANKVSSGNLRYEDQINNANLSILKKQAMDKDKLSNASFDDV